MLESALGLTMGKLIFRTLKFRAHEYNLHLFIIPTTATYSLGSQGYESDVACLRTPKVEMLLYFMELYTEHLGVNPGLMVSSPTSIPFPILVF